MLVYLMGGLLLLGVVLLVIYNVIKTNKKYNKTAILVFKVGLLLSTMSATYLLFSLFVR